MMYPDKIKMYMYVSKELPEATQALLKEKGFACKRRLWYRIVEKSILQMIHLRCLGQTRLITFSSDPLFAPLHADPASKAWFVSAGQIPSFRTHTVTAIEQAQHHYLFSDVHISYRTTDEKEGLQLEQIIHSQVESLVLHYLDRVDSVEKNFQVATELTNLARYGWADFPCTWQERVDPVTLYELLYLGQYRTCVAAADALRNIVPRHEDIRKAAVAEDRARIREILEETLAINQKLLSSQLRINTELEG